MTHRGPFQPRPFCDSVISKRRYCLIFIEKIEPFPVCWVRRSADAGVGQVMFIAVFLRVQECVALGGGPHA